MANETIIGSDVTAEMKTTVISSTGCAVHEAGAVFRARPGVANQCSRTIVLEDAPLCEDRVWLVTIPAGEAYQATVDSGLALCVNSSSDVAYLFGTEASPIVIPADMAEITVDAPELLLGGEEHSINLTDVTEIGLINCSATDDIKVQLTFKGC